MNQFLNYLVPGIADGSVYALAALGLVLTYKTSGVFNFAHGALAATAAYLFYEGYVEQGWPWPFAFAVSLLVVGVLGGLLLERLASALASAPTVTTVVATVGLLVLLQSLMTAIYGSADKKAGDFLPTNGPRVGDVTISYGDMMVTGFCVGAAVLLFLFFGRSRTGKAMTAVVDDPNLLALQKTNPSAVRRLSWVLGSCFASISGMLLAPKLGVSVNVLVLIVIAAYGAAAVGLFENLPLTVGGAFGIGVMVNYFPSVAQRSDSLFLQSLPRNIPFLVLLLVFLLVPARKLTERGVRNARRFKAPTAFPLPITSAGLGVLAVALIAVPHVVSATDITVYSSFVAYAIIFLSLGMLLYLSGMISLCHLGFAAVGATTSGKLMTLGFFDWLPLIGGKTVSWPVAILIGGLIAVPLGAIVAIPAIRLAGIYVAVATFGFGILLQQAFYLAPVMFDVGALVQHPRPGTEFYVPGTASSEPVEGTTAPLLGVDFLDEKNYYYLALAVFVVMAALVLLVLHSRLGTLLRAMSDSPVALDAHGANTNVMRVLVFCLSAFMAGVGGGVLAGATQSASGSPGGTFDYTTSLIFVAILGFCGRRPILSPLLAAFAFQVVKIYPPFDHPTMIEYRGVMFGALAILVAIWPALNLGNVMGRRAHERTEAGAGGAGGGRGGGGRGGGGRSVRGRLDAPPVRPVSVRASDGGPGGGPGGGVLVSSGRSGS